MKIIHTSDWHIGKIVNQTHMTADQEYILAAFVQLLAEEKPDALLIAGDVYDRSVPPVEAVELLNKTLCAILLDLKIPVLMIAGNHDSPDRLDFGSQILKTKGLHIEGRLKKSIRKETLHDDYGPVHFYLVPYAQPSLVRDLLGKPDICDHDTAMAAIIDAIETDWDPAGRNVMVTHGFVRGIGEPELSESEKPLAFTSIGGADYVKVNRFDGFTYTALGHLHGPQRSGSDKVRYAGSLLKYSFSEVKQQKSVTVVTIGKDGNVEVEQKKLLPLRDMRRVTGSLAELLTPHKQGIANHDDYIHVTLTDDDDQLEPMRQLRTVYPNILGLDFAERVRVTGESKTAAGSDYKHKSKLELFREFYCNISGQELSPERERIAADVISQVETSGGDR